MGPHLGGEAGDLRAEVVALLEGGRVVDGSGEEPLAERAERHEPDPVRVAHGKHLLFGSPPPQRVLALHGSDRGDRVGALDGLRRCLRQPPTSDLAGIHQVSDRAGEVFDGCLGIDPVLVVEVDVIGPQSAQRAVDRVTDIAGEQHPAARLPFYGSMSCAYLVAMTTASRTGSSASPTSSSLACGP